MTQITLGRPMMMPMLPMMTTDLLVVPLVTTALYVHYHYLVTPPSFQWQWLVAIMMMVGLVVTMIGIIALGLVRSMLSPPTLVSEGMRRLAQGELTMRICKQRGSGGQISSLEEEFNSLAEHLQRSSEQRVFMNAAIAHELRTPVAILRARLQGFADGILPFDRSQMTSLLAQTAYLTQLVDDLHVVTLAECGHLTLCRREADLSSEVASVVELHREVLAKAGQKVVMDLEHHIVSCDSMRIR